MSKEMVNHPAHYNQGNIEVIDAVDDWNLNFALGSAVKYIARAEHKENKLQDLMKADWYLTYEINKDGADSDYSPFDFLLDVVRDAYTHGEATREEIEHLHNQLKLLIEE